MEPREQEQDQGVEAVELVAFSDEVHTWGERMEYQVRSRSRLKLSLASLRRRQMST
jgi:hypothetical protein